jgi:hypothetical protein
MEMKFRAVTGKILTLTVEPEATVGEMKRLLEEQHGLVAANLKMILSAKVLDDATQAKDISVPPGTYIVVHASSRRSAPAPAAPPPAAAPALAQPPPSPARR